MPAVPTNSNGFRGQLEIPPVMESVLRPHQVDALHFIWQRLVLNGALRTAARTFSSTIEQRTRLFQEVSGAILGHSMGLGKTLTSLTFVLLFQAQVTLMAMKRERMRQQQQGSSSGADKSGSAAALGRLSYCPALRVLVLCPRSCVLHWQASIAEWVHPRYAGGSARLDTHVPSAMGLTASSPRSGGRTLDDVLLAYYQNGGVLLLGYEEYQRLLQYAQTQYRNRTSTTWPRTWSLLDRIRVPLPLTTEVRLLDVLETADLVILDEAHRLRRSTSHLVTGLTQHLRNVQLRLALTGTPLQNHLEEYNTMQSIVTGRELDTQLFHRHFIAPIELGQCVDSSYAQFLEMQRCVASLRNYFADSAHHCGSEVLAATLPPRRECLFFFKLSAAQETAYKAMLQFFYAQLGSAEKGDSVLRLHHVASHICLHPALADAEMNGGVGTAASAAHGSSVKDKEEDRDEDEDPAASPVASPVVPAASLAQSGKLSVGDSPKLSFALHLTLYIVQHLREKVVIFSQYLSHLKLMGELLAVNGISAPALTGAASDADRRRCIDELQSNPACKVLLCSVRAGGVGIKLTAANHCILLDVSWNPADDSQATYRLYRYGQLRPVTVYRLATWGTSEHVVFAYALQKSWLQKKITDVSDPRRQQRHQTRSYFRYPCKIPLPESVPPLTLQELADLPPSQAAQQAVLEERRRAYLRRVCETQCPAAAEVLHAHPDDEGASLHTVIPQSMLLQHTDEDVIRDRGRQFEEAAQKKRAMTPIPLQLNPQSRSTAVQREDQSLLDICEPELVDAARQTAHLILAHALQVQHTAHNSSSSGSSSQRRGDTVAEVRMLDRALCQHLLPLVAPLLQRRPAPQSLAEVLLWCYQTGAAAVARILLHGGAHLKLRTYLTSRIPATARHHPRDASLPLRSPLEEALLFRPVSLFRAIAAVEATYVCTELGCDRPFVGSCMLQGLQLLWGGNDNCTISNAVGGTGHVTPLSETALQSLAALLGSQSGDADEEEEDDDEQRESDTEERSARRDDDAGPAAKPAGESVAEPLAQSVLVALLQCLEEQWPPFEGLALPPQQLQLEREEQRMERAYSAATKAHTEGLLPLSEAATLLKLPCYRQGYHAYGCSRCQNLLLQRVDATHFECPRCHFNAEFELRADPRMQQRALLYQLSVVANLLDAFSITKSFAVSFSPADCADVSAALREVHSSHAVFEFVRHIMQEGAQVFVNEYPPSLIRLTGLQLGTGGDVERLNRVLCANGRLACHTSMRDHVRQRVALAFAEFVHPSKLTSFAAMPLMLIVSGVHYLARYEKLVYAHELLLEEYPTPHRKLLRFASDALVKILYVERLLQHCKEKPRPASAAARVAGLSSASPHEGRDAAAQDDDDAASLTSLLMAASSSSSSSSSDSPARKRRRSPSSESSSSSSSLSSSVSSGSSRSRSRSSSSERERRQRFQPQRPRGSKPPPATVELFEVSSDAVSSSSASETRSRSSSFHSVYSHDRESFPEQSASDTEEHGDRGGMFGLDATGTWLEALAQNTLETRVPTTEELESEAVLQQRSAQYWIAFCEVYGTHSAEALAVFIEDGANGMKAMAPPPLSLWVSQVGHTTLAGLRMADMLDLFLEKLLELSQQVRLIT